MTVSHPYYPVHIALPGYVANEWPFTSLLGVVAAACTSVLALAWVVAKRLRPDLPRTEVLTVLWFVLCASLHLFFESYYVRNWRVLAADQALLGQLWKEYAYSDSRYLTQDVSVLCLEAITVVLWGPLSLLSAYMILSSHPMRYGLQIIVSMAHLYGVIMYYATSLAELWFLGSSYSRPESLYFWVYFVGFNAPWLFVPIVLIWNALSEIASMSEVVYRGASPKRTKPKKS